MKLSVSKSEILAHFKKIDPIIENQLQRMNFEVFVPQLDHTKYFAKLCRTITGQQSSVKAAATIHGRFLELVGEQPIPERILALSDDELRTVGLSRAKT
jgi:3-methyladenine DNA glycosylase/8-oxoguanine DNA glycosylase